MVIWGCHIFSNILYNKEDVVVVVSYVIRMSFEYIESEIIKLGSVVFSFVCSLGRLFTPEMSKLC